MWAGNNFNKDYVSSEGSYGFLIAGNVIVIVLTVSGRMLRYRVTEFPSPLLQ